MLRPGISSPAADPASRTQVLDKDDETYVYLKGLCHEMNFF
jgi:hypothetical protein